MERAVDPRAVTPPPTSNGGNATLPKFMDVHHGMHGVTPEALQAAHQADLDIQGEEGVDFQRAWADPESGMVWCVSEARTRTPFAASTSERDTVRRRCIRSLSRSDRKPAAQLARATTTGGITSEPRPTRSWARPVLRNNELINRSSVPRVYQPPPHGRRTRPGWFSCESRPRPL